MICPDSIEILLIRMSLNRLHSNDGDVNPLGVRVLLAQFCKEIRLYALQVLPFNQ